MLWRVMFPCPWVVRLDDGPRYEGKALRALVYGIDHGLIFICHCCSNLSVVISVGITMTIYVKVEMVGSLGW